MTADPSEIQIQFNGTPRQMPAGASIADLLVAEGLAGARVAVECNGEIVPRSQHPHTRLQRGDRVEVVHAIGGG